MTLLAWKLFYNEISGMWLVLEETHKSHKARLACGIWLSGEPWPGLTPAILHPERSVSAPQPGAAERGGSLLSGGVACSTLHLLRVFFALQSGDQDPSQPPNQRLSNSSVHQNPWGLRKCRGPEPHPQFLIQLAWVEPTSVFLLSSQMILMLLACENARGIK